MLGLGCVEGSNTVTRMAGGVRYEGRFVNPEAYAAYLQGALREAQGDYKNALSSYLEAHAEDPDSPEVWARIGAIQCVTASPESGPKAARFSFQRGVRSDPSYYGNYLERARCAERAHALPAALVDATAAVARRPQDEAANLLVIRVLGALGRTNEARTWREAFQTYRASSAALRREPPVAREASVATARLAAHSAAFAELGTGHAERARSQAQLELAADPSNADAWVAALVACDALRDAQCFETALTSLRAPSLPASETALRFLRELIARRTGAAVTF